MREPTQKQKDAAMAQSELKSEVGMDAFRRGMEAGIALVRDSSATVWAAEYTVDYGIGPVIQMPGGAAPHTLLTRFCSNCARALARGGGSTCPACGHTNP